ncbi:MAG: sigma-70 family RNA polymerase sigma factor [Planctomycetota bacterium]
MLRSGLDRAFGRYARTGDPGALARVFDGCAVELYRIGFHLLGDRHAAEDLVQQTFVVAIEQAKTFERSRRVLPWLCGILTNRALHLRRQARQRAAAAVADAVADPVAEAAAREVQERVASTVRSLPEPYRQVLLMHLVHELAPKEVAEALARPDATVRTQLARGLELLRKALPIGFAGMAAGCVPAPVGLATVRAAVLAHAGAAGAGMAATAGLAVVAFSGVTAMKKVVAAVVVLLAVVGSWPWWGGAAPAPAIPDAGVKAATSAVPQTGAMPSPAASPTPSPGDADRVAAPASVDPRTAALEVLVLWHDGTPAADIAVRCRPLPLDFETWLRAARTGDDGVAHFTAMPPGAANVLTGRGTNADVELAPGSILRTTITLDAGIDVRGRVVDLDEKPVAGATVWMSVTPMSDDGEPVAVSAPDGTFSIRGAGQDFVVMATAPGFGAAKEAWVRKPEMVLTLRPVPGVVVGTVVDPARQPVPGARILLGVTSNRGAGHQRFFGQISGQDLWPSRFLRTDADGRFRSEGLPALRWPMWIGAPGFAPGWQEVIVRADGPTEVTVRLAHGATVRGRITDQAGIGVKDVEIHAHPDLPAPHELIGLAMKELAMPPLWSRKGTRTAEDGSYQLPHVMVGKLTLRAWSAAGRAKIECEVVEGQTFVWDATIAPPIDPSWRPLHGVLLDEDGKALTGWEMRVGDPTDAGNLDPPYNQFWVGDDGSFRTNRVPPGRYPLFVKPRAPMIGGEVGLGEFDLANSPLRLVVPRAEVPAARVCGRIVPPGGVLAATCFVWVMPAQTNSSVRVRCDDQGRFEAGPVLHGSFRMKVENADFGEVAMSPIEVVDGRDCDVGTFQVPSPGTLVVRMVDAAGQRVPDAWVVVRPVGDDRRGGSLDHRDGTARGNLQPGRWLVCSREQTTMAAIEVDVRAGETTETNLVIPDGVPFVLRVPAAAGDRGRLRLHWRDATGGLVRDCGLYEDETGKDLPFKAPAGRYTLDVVDPHGGKASATIDLRASDPPPVFELPLPARDGR